MENKNTKELRGYKAGLKSKLMGAVAMLLVSAIMVSSATYAWFVLSTHPEVKGMSTTVGSNGALEIALLNNKTGADLSKVTANVGDSAKGVTESNETWGNIVDLSDAGYGWADVKLYPAALNVGADNNPTDRSALLRYAKYGTDGRITELAANTAAGKRNAENTGFFADSVENPDYGVRAIGTTTNASAGALALATVKANYKNSTIGDQQNPDGARYSIIATLNTYREQLSAIAMAHANGDGNETYTQNSVDAINGSLDAVKNAAQKLQEALKWATAAEALATSGGTEVPKLESIQLDSKYTEADAALGAIATEAESNKIATQENTYTWENIRVAYQYLMNTNSMTFQSRSGGKVYTMAEMKTISITDGMAMAGAGAKITLSEGAFVKIADYVENFESSDFTMTIKVTAQGKEQEIPMDKSFYSVVTAKSPATMTPITTTVNGLKAQDGGSEQAAITNVYGYIVDLAFQTNIAGNLQLQGEGVNRVSSDTSTATQGGGTLFTVTGDADAAALAAMRVVFISGDNKILAVGKFDTTPTTGNDKAYALHLYKYTFENGALKATDTKVADDTITALEANTPVAVSALVYLDGDSTSYAQGGITGTLNLQFKHSAGDLSPMNYDFSAGGDQQP